jgi:RNase P subunit RPR2
MLNLITGTCEACGDDYSGMDREIVRGLRQFAQKEGPLRDRLVMKVALDSERYPSGCTCGRPKLDPPKPHAVECPASKRGERYIVHLVEPETARPAQLSEGDVAFVAGLRSKLRAAAGYGDEDVRTICPECAGELTPAGDNRVECKPCGVSLIADVSAALDFQAELQPLEVWHCPNCDACFAFRQIPIMNAIVLAGDDRVPIECFGCGGQLEQWVVMRPLIGKIESGLAELIGNPATAAAAFSGEPDDKAN